MTTSGDSKAEDFVFCTFCSEIDANVKCSNGHILCMSCAQISQKCYKKFLALYRLNETVMRFKQKISDDLAGKINDEAFTCPLDNCFGMIADFPEQTMTKIRKKIVSVVKLSQKDENFIRVADAFAGPSASKHGTIIGIYAINNPALLTLYNTCKELMEKETRVVNGSDVGGNETWLFHGTNRIATGNIMRGGFDIRKSGTANGQALGPGIYFAKDAGTSHSYTDPDIKNIRCMLYCKVLLGDTRGRDCVSSGSSVFVVMREQQIYPAYIIYYKEGSDPVYFRHAGKDDIKLAKRANKNLARFKK